MLGRLAGLIFALGLLATAAFGGAVSGRGKADITLVPGAPIVVTLADGRVAQVDLDARAPLVAPLPLEVTENTCNDYAKMRCVYTTALALNQLALRWVRHPDAAKIGQTVQFTRAGVSGAFLLFDFVAQSDRVAKPKIASRLPTERLACDDFRWILGAGAAAPESAAFHRWDVEAMQTNPETGLMENRTLGMSLGVRLGRRPAGDMEIVEVKRYVGTSLALFSGDLWSLVSKQPDGNFCLVTVKAQFAKVIQDFMKYFAVLPSWKPYAYLSDEYTTTAMNVEFARFLASSEEYELK